MDDRPDRPSRGPNDDPITDPGHPGAIEPGGALGASEAPIGRDKVAREAQRQLEQERTTEELADELHARVTGRTQHG
ncbi:MAG: hypothetical protein U0869_18915 [Chloroflexota bacterium]